MGVLKKTNMTLRDASPLDTYTKSPAGLGIVREQCGWEKKTINRLALDWL